MSGAAQTCAAVSNSTQPASLNIIHRHSAPATVDLDHASCHFCSHLTHINHQTTAMQPHLPQPATCTSASHAVQPHCVHPGETSRAGCDDQNQARSAWMGPPMPGYDAVAATGTGHAPAPVMRCLPAAPLPFPLRSAVPSFLALSLAICAASCASMSSVMACRGTRQRSACALPSGCCLALVWCNSCHLLLALLGCRASRHHES
jgi:hypothetical protein